MIAGSTTRVTRSSSRSVARSPTSTMHDSSSTSSLNLAIRQRLDLFERVIKSQFVAHTTFDAGATEGEGPRGCEGPVGNLIAIALDGFRCGVQRSFVSGSGTVTREKRAGRVEQ